MEEALAAYLLAQAGLTALVGQRITWARRQQGAELPAIVLHTVSVQPDYTMQGASGLVSARVQVDVWGDSYGSAKLTARQVVAALSGVRFGSFQGSFQESERDDFERSEAGESLYRVSLDFTLWHERA